MADVRIRFQGDSSDARNEARRLSSELGRIKDRAVTVRVDTRGGQRAVQQLERTVDSGARRMRGAVAGLAGAAGFGGLSVGVIAAARAGIQWNATVESQLTAFKNLLGSAKEGQRVFDDLVKTAATTPFELPQLTSATQRLLAFNFKADEAKRILLAAGDAAAAMGGSPELIDRVTLALGQMAVRGKVSAEELNQLAEANVNAFGYLRDQFGLTAKDFNDLGKTFEAKGIGIQQVIQTIIRGMEKDFGGAMEAQSHTFSGQLSTLRDNVNMTLGSITKGLFDAARNGWLPELNRMTGQVQKLWDDTGKTTQEKLAQTGRIIRTSGIARDVRAGLADVAEWAQVELPTIMGKAFINVGMAAPGKIVQGFAAAEWPGQALIGGILLAKLSPALRWLGQRGGAAGAAGAAGGLASAVPGAPVPVVVVGGSAGGLGGAVAGAGAAGGVAAGGRFSRALGAAGRVAPWLAAVPLAYGAGSALGGQVGGGYGSSIGGGVAGGAALGATIGSVVPIPGLGTLTGAIAGGVAGGTIAGLRKAFGGPGAQQIANEWARTLGEATRRGGDDAIARLTTRIGRIRSALPGSARTSALDRAESQLGGRATTQLVSDLRSGPVNRTVEGVLKRVTDLFDDLPARARQQGVSAVLQYARGMEEKGRLPEQATEEITKRLMDRYEDLADFIPKKGLDSMEGLERALKTSRVGRAADQVIAGIKRNWEDAPRFAKTTGENIQRNFGTAFEFLNQKIATTTGKQKKEAQEALTALQKAYNRLPDAIGSPAERAGERASAAMTKLRDNALAIARSLGVSLAGGERQGALNTALGPSYGGIPQAHTGGIFAGGKSQQRIVQVLGGERILTRHQVAAIDAQAGRPGYVDGMIRRVKRHHSHDVGGTATGLPVDLPSPVVAGGDAFSRIGQGYANRLHSALSRRLAAAVARGGSVAGNMAIGRLLAARRGWTGGEWDALRTLWMNESGWRATADNPTSDAYGIPQSLPGSKMAAAGADWRTNPATQITWGLNYIGGRYGSPSAALAAWQSRSPHWYHTGGVIPSFDTGGTVPLEDLPDLVRLGVTAGLGRTGATRTSQLINAADRDAGIVTGRGRSRVRRDLDTVLDVSQARADVRAGAAYRGTFVAARRGGLSPDVAGSLSDERRARVEGASLNAQANLVKRGIAQQRQLLQRIRRQRQQVTRTGKSGKALRTVLARLRASERQVSDRIDTLTAQMDDLRYRAWEAGQTLATGAREQAEEIAEQRELAAPTVQTALESLQTDLGVEATGAGLSERAAGRAAVRAAQAGGESDPDRLQAIQEQAILEARRTRLETSLARVRGELARVRAALVKRRGRHAKLLANLPARSYQRGVPRQRVLAAARKELDAIEKLEGEEEGLALLEAQYAGELGQTVADVEELRDPTIPSSTTAGEAGADAGLSDAERLRAAADANRANYAEAFIRTALGPGDIGSGAPSAWQAAGGGFTLVVQTLDSRDPEYWARVARYAGAGWGLTATGSPVTRTGL